MTERRRPARRMRALAAASCLAALAAVARSGDAADSARVARYEIDVTPRGDGTASLRVLIVYADASGKSDGFKFVGTSAPSHLHGADELGADLAAHAFREDRSGEYEILFDLVPALAPEKQAILTFDQELELDDALLAPRATLSWAPNFRLRVDQMTVRLHGSELEAPKGYACSGGGGDRVCTKTATSTFPVAFPLARPRFGALAGLGAAALAWLALALYVVKRKYDHVLATRGVIPTLEREAYPELVSGGYRSPPVPEIPRGGEAKPELLAWDVAAIRQRVVAAAILTFGPATFAWIWGPTFAPITAAVVYASAGLLCFAWLVLREKPLVTWWMVPSVVALVLACAEQAPRGTVPVFVLAVNLLLWVSVIAASKGGGGSSGGSVWTSGSSSFGSSGHSCGGGGGSSCGGGGGSSCGGGGGGGGGCGG